MTQESTGAVRGNPGGEWRIAETSKRCETCGRLFVAGRGFFSLLRIDSSGDDELPTLVRQDYCPPCWEHVAKRLESPIFWKTRRQGGDDDRAVVDLNALHTLFMKLLEDTRPEIEALRYVVALMLVRKKILRVVRGAGGARGDLVFKDPRDLEKRLRLPSPELTEEALDGLKEQLGQILG